MSDEVSREWLEREIGYWDKAASAISVGEATDCRMLAASLRELLARRSADEADRQSVCIEWDRPMTSREAARYHLTGGFVPIELYRHATRAADEGAVVVEYDPAGEAMMGATLSHHAPIPESIRTILKAMGEGPCTVTIRREVKP